MNFGGLPQDRIRRSMELSPRGDAALPVTVAAASLASASLTAEGPAAPPAQGDGDPHRRPSRASTAIQRSTRCTSAMS